MTIHIPKILLYSRIVFVIAILYLTLFRTENSEWIVLTLMYAGIISDIFDGIIARKLNVSTENFRVLDTVFDLLFYLSILLYIFKTNEKVCFENVKIISTIIILESLMYCISLARFRKLPSPHAILSKFWGIYMIIEFTLLIVGVTGDHFTVALFIGTIVHFDRILIHIFIRHWDHDIPSCYHAFQLRHGKTIIRKKIFNG